MKWLSVVAVLLLVLAPVLGAELGIVGPKAETFQRGAPFYFTVQVFENGTLQTGASASCRLTVYNETGVALEANLSSSSFYYRTLINNTVEKTTGSYPYTAWCNTTSSAGFISDRFDITPTGLPWAKGEDLTPVAVIVLLPFLLALITIVGSVTLDPEEHPALKIGLFLFSYLPFYVSLWWGAEAVGRWYNFPALTEAIGSGTFFGIIFFILLVFYVVLYFIIKAFQAIAEKNAKRLSY